MAVDERQSWAPQLTSTAGRKFPIFVPAGMSQWKVVAFRLPFWAFFFKEYLEKIKTSCLAVVQTRLEVKRAFLVLENSSSIDSGDKQQNVHNEK